MSDTLLREAPDRFEKQSDQNTNRSGRILVWGAIIAFIGLLLASLLKKPTRLRAKRIFISFAIEDEQYRDFIVQQAKDDRSPFTFTDMSVKEPLPGNWKSRCRARIRRCDGMIAMLSKQTWNAGGARWEMKCANEEGVPLIGVHIQKDNKGAIPPELDGNEVIEWTWDGIRHFMDSIPNR